MNSKVVFLGSTATKSRRLYAPARKGRILSFCWFNVQKETGRLKEDDAFVLLVFEVGELVLVEQRLKKLSLLHSHFYLLMVELLEKFFTTFNFVTNNFFQTKNIYNFQPS